MRISTILTAICLSLAAPGSAYSWDPANFSADGMKWQPAPSGHVVGKDNGPGAGLHHSGEDCGICHRPGGSAASMAWTASGTIYADRAARVPLPDAEVMLQDYQGGVISMTTNGAGNFWTAAPIASHPYTVASTHGGPPFVPLYKLDEEGNLLEPADPADPRTWKYKTWVKKGDSVVPMVTIASAGGSPTTPRMSCNMHHGATSHRSGGMWAGRDNVLARYPKAHLSYRSHVFPILREKCAPCHIPGVTRTPVGAKSDLDSPSTVVDYSGGLDLMSYAGYAGVAVPKSGLLDVVTPYGPERSILFEKAMSGEGHAGGAIWQTPGDPEYRAIYQWVAEGARNN